MGCVDGSDESNDLMGCSVVHIQQKNSSYLCSDLIPHAAFHCCNEVDFAPVGVACGSGQ